MLLGTLKLQRDSVRHIMVHRPDMVGVEAAESVAVAAQSTGKHGFLRLPVFDGSPDNIVGYIHASDVVAAYLAGGTDRPVRSAMREAVFESQLAPTMDILDRMNNGAAHMVFLVDEFGATTGRVTLEDVMEVVVGKLRSESGVEGDADDVRLGGRLIVAGQRSLSELDDQLGVDFSCRRRMGRSRGPPPDRHRGGGTARHLGDDRATGGPGPRGRGSVPGPALTCDRPDRS